MYIKAKKSLGQHFLNSPAVLAKIIEAARLKEGEAVLEIGPGGGVLTRALLSAGAEVVAVEKDDRAYNLLGVEFERDIRDKALNLHLADILGAEPASFGLGNGKYALVANIPYYITGAILEKFLEYEPRPNRMVLLVQKEVAERIVAQDGKESILSISVKAFGTPKIISRVPRGAFTPAPNVDSAILSIENVSNTHFAEKGLVIKRFFDIVRAGFAHKRKFVKRNLEGVATADVLNRIWHELKLGDKLRAEDLTLDQWLGITLYL